MKNLRNILVVLMCLVMVFAFAACTKPAVTEPTKAPAEETQAPAEETEAPGEETTPPEEEIPYWRTPCAETVTVTCVKGYNPPEDPDTPAGTTVENQALNVVLREKFNIILDWLWTVPSEQYNQKFNLSIASGQIPDLLNIDLNQFLDFVDAGQLADLGPALEQWAMPEVREEYSYYDDVPLQQCTFDGKILSLPCLLDNAENLTHYFYRNDWLDDVNMEVPSSIEEVCDLAIAFATNNVSGKDETIGLLCAQSVFNGGNTWSLDGFANGYGAYPYKWIRAEDGSLIYGSIQPEVKDALDRIKQLYNDGGISREFVSHDWNKQGELVIAGQVGSFYGGWWVPNWPCNLAMEEDFDTDWKMIVIPSTVDGVPGKSFMQRNVIVWYNCLSKDAMAGADEALVKILNLFYDVSYMAPDEQYSIDTYGDVMRPTKEGGTWVWNWGPVWIYQARCQALNMEAVQKAWEAQDPTMCDTQYRKDLYEATEIYMAGEKKEGYGKAWGLWYSRVANDGGIGLSYYTKNNGLFVYDEFYGPPTPTQLEKQSTLNDLAATFWVNYVLGTDTDFEGFVNSWKTQGGDAWTAEANAQYVELGYAE